MSIDRKISRILVAAFVCVALVVSSAAIGAEGAHADSKKMKVTSAAVKNGYIDAKYCYTNSSGEANTRSLPLKIENSPAGTKYYAIYMYDKTYPWVHWLAANYKSSNVPANASKDKKKSMVQGKNDFGKVGYGGPTPPDKTHTYVVKVYALKSKVDLKSGFTYTEFTKAIKGKVLKTATLSGKCKVK
jgi:Raf kinase inhibitor-like YbhB/YbcL family protein